MGMLEFLAMAAQAIAASSKQQKENQYAAQQGAVGEQNQDIDLRNQALADRTRRAAAISRVLKSPYNPAETYQRAQERAPLPPSTVIEQDVPGIVNAVSLSGLSRLTWPVGMDKPRGSVNWTDQSPTVQSDIYPS